MTDIGTYDQHCKRLYEERGYIIIDPDGFDRRDWRFHERLYSYGAFCERALFCTIMMEPK